MDDDIKPFLRWAGGKRWLAKKLSPVIRKRIGLQSKYIEPFLGSGAMFFGSKANQAILSDLNADLIITYQQVAQYPEEIIERLYAIPSNKKQYYEIRSWEPKNDLERAVRLIYLNRNCFGGIYRENLKGEFNVPFGGGSRNHFSICENGNLIETSKVLNSPGILIRCSDFEATIKEAQQGDIVYCDPTYSEVTRSKFDRYGKIIFNWNDQIRLADSAINAYESGALVLISNAKSPEIQELFDGFQQIEVVRKKGLGRESSKLIQSEVLIIMDPLDSKEEWSELF